MAKNYTVTGQAEDKVQTRVYNVSCAADAAVEFWEEMEHYVEAILLVSAPGEPVSAHYHPEHIDGVRQSADRNSTLVSVYSAD